VNDPVLGEVTEASLNQVPESQTADRFKGVEPYDPGDYQVLIVAEKFQTGFDFPALHTMFVDKTLTGVAVVQTLSRLNRTMAGKEDTFVLDFRNDADVIAREFQRYYEATTTQPTHANVLTDAYDLVMGFGVISEEEMAKTVDTYFTASSAGPALGKIYAAFSPALGRFGQLTDDEQDQFRSALSGFVSLYAFMSQILTWTDADGQRLYIYGRGLAKLLPKAPDGRLNLGSDVVLTHLRLEDEGRQDIDLVPGEAEPGTTFPGQGQGSSREARRDKLGNITEELNSAFGLNLNERDRLVFEQFEESWYANTELREVAVNNDLDAFRLEFEQVFKTTVLDNEEANQDLYERIYTDDKFSKKVIDWYLLRMFELFRSEAVV
jgi:type I restriction enzyme R subunit